MSGNIIVLLVSFVIVVHCEVPDYIHVCKRGDPQLADCIKSSIDTLLPRLRVGIPELEIPSLEPLHLKNVALKTGTEAARIATNLTDLTVWNASTFKILELVPNIPKNSFTFKVTVPQIHIEGGYEIDSKILLLELKGKGPLEINVTDYQFDCIMQGNRQIINNKEHLVFEKMKLNIGISKGSILLKNLFNGNPTLGRLTNEVINDNLDIFFEEMKPRFEEGLSTAFTDIANKIVLSFTYDELFPI